MEAGVDSCRTGDGSAMAPSRFQTLLDVALAASDSGRKHVSRELRELIFRMVAENSARGVPRIHGELKMLSFDISERTALRWMRRAPRSPEPASVSLSTGQIWASNYLTDLSQFERLEMFGRIDSELENNPTSQYKFPPKRLGRGYSCWFCDAGDGGNFGSSRPNWLANARYWIFTR
jgi:hypothetical protein